MQSKLREALQRRDDAIVAARHASRLAGAYRSAVKVWAHFGRQRQVAPEGVGATEGARERRRHRVSRESLLGLSAYLRAFPRRKPVG